MKAICLLVAEAVRATLPAEPFTLAWTHSVQLIRWQEHYRPEGDALVLTRASAPGTGAGLEIPADAIREGTNWVWRPQRRLDALTLSRSAFAGPYELCQRGRCRALDDIVGAAEPEKPVTIAACS